MLVMLTRIMAEITQVAVISISGVKYFENNIKRFNLFPSGVNCLRFFIEIKRKSCYHMYIQKYKHYF